MAKHMIILIHFVSVRPQLEVLCVFFFITLSFFLVHVYVCCRRGNDSQLAVLALRSLIKEYQKSDGSLEITVKDLVGGLMEWTESIDPTFPKY